MAGRFPKDLSKTAEAGGTFSSRAARRRHGKGTRMQRSRERIKAETLGAGPNDDVGSKNVTAITVSPKWFEICRKISYVIVTQGEQYEVPPLWDDTETSPTWDNGLPDPAEPWFKLERPHEIWYMDANFTRHIETFYVATEASDPVVTSIPLIVVEALVNTDVDVDARIYSALLSSTQAQSAIAQAQSEV